MITNVDIAFKSFLLKNPTSVSSKNLFWIWNAYEFILVEGLHSILPLALQIPPERRDSKKNVDFYTRKPQSIEPRRPWGLYSFINMYFMSIFHENIFFSVIVLPAICWKSFCSRIISPVLWDVRHMPRWNTIIGHFLTQHTYKSDTNTSQIQSKFNTNVCNLN